MTIPDRAINTISISWNSIDDTPPNIKTGNPSTKPILKIFVPMMFPKMISNSFFFADVIAITNSGALVPITRIIIVISFSLIPILCAKSAQLSTAKSLPTDMRIKPMMAIIIDFPVFHLGFSFLSNIVLCVLINLPIYIKKPINVANNITPSNLDIPFPSTNTIANIITVNRCNGSCFFTVSFLTLIGFINDVEIDGDSIEIGYVIHPNHKNKGYASEVLAAAIKELFRIGYSCIRTGLFSDNNASRHVMEKCGMKLTSKTDEIEYRGKVHHCNYYEITK